MGITVVSADALHTIDWSRVTKGCIYLDIHGQIHIEIGHHGYLPFFHNTNWWDLLVRQDRFYAKLTDRILAACRTKPAHELIGARQFAFVPGVRWLLSTALALRDTPQPNAIRQQAHAQLVEIFNKIADLTNARCAITGTAVVDPARMTRHGWTHVTNAAWWIHTLHRLAAFPLRNQQLFVRQYPATQLEQSAQPTILVAAQ